MDPEFDDVGLYALRAESDRFLMGPVPASATRVELQFEGGEKRRVEPVEGFVLFALSIDLGDLRRAVAFDRAGDEVGRQELGR